MRFIDGITGNYFPLYCAFEPKIAWTLIESFSLANTNTFKNLPFHVHRPISNNRPSTWENYRMGSNRRAHFQIMSTLFAATCDFPKRVGGSMVNDSLKGRLDDFNVVQEKSLDGCKKYTSINIKGVDCSNCTAYTVSGGVYVVPHSYSQ